MIKKPVLNYNGNVLRSGLASTSAPYLVTSLEAALLTGPSGGIYTVHSILVCDKSGSGDTVTVRLYASALGATALANLFTTVTVAANDTLTLDFGSSGLPLYNGQILAILSGTGSRLTATPIYAVEQ